MFFSINHSFRLFRLEWSANNSIDSAVVDKQARS